MYALENDGKLWYEGLAVGGGHGLWFNRMREYYGEADQARYCPEAPATELMTIQTGGGGFHGSTFQSYNMAGHQGNPTDDDSRRLLGASIGINMWITSTPDGGGPTWGPPAKFWQGIAENVSVADIPTVGDCTWFGAEVSDATLGTDFNVIGANSFEYRHPEDVYRDDPPLTGPSGNGWNMYYSRVLLPRHLGRANWAFMDGSARPVELEELPGLNWHRDYRRLFDVFIPWNNQ